MSVQQVSMRQNPWKTVSHSLKTGGLWGTAQDFAKFLQLAGSFLLHDTVDSLGSFRFTWSLTHAPAVISPRNSILPQMVSP